MDLGWPEILLILAIVLIVFGVGKLPQIGSSMGKAIREFKAATRGDDEPKTKPVTEATAIVTDAPRLSVPVAAGDGGNMAAENELTATKARLAATEARLKELEQSSRQVTVSKSA